MRRSLTCAVIAAALALGSTAASSALVNISGQLTSFQSALSSWGDGDGTLNGQGLVIDPSAPPVSYRGDSQLFPQSTTVALAPGTQSVQFEYTSLIGNSIANPNVVSFTSAGPVDVNQGDLFRIGSISYTNGFWFPFARIGLSLWLNSADPTLDGHRFDGSIVVEVSSGDGSSADVEADYFYLESAAGPLSALGSVRVYERAFQPPGMPGNTGSADLFVRIGSLIPTHFANPTGGAVLSASLDPFSNDPTVPEPTSLALMLAALAAAGCATRGRKSR